ncbi:MAG: tetratricopeptide repeat protein, partial [Chloroflexi bacterium]|nr:tetratricopeptide repeat protein [Chloroflexota bacterium]
YQQALALFREIGAKLGEANVLQAIGDVQQFRKETDAALASYQQALALFREIGDRLGEANVRQAIGDVQQFRDERDAALASYQQALALFREIGDRLGEANVLAALSRLHIDNDPGESRQLLERALSIRRIIGDVYGEGADLGNYAIALLRHGRNDEALTCLKRARTLFASRGLVQQVAQTESLIAQARGASQAGVSNSDPVATPGMLPPAIRTAIEAGDVTALTAALRALPSDEAASIIEQLQRAGIIGTQPAQDNTVSRFEPLLAAIADIASGDESQRAEVETLLAKLEEKGWHLTEPVGRIWQGERDPASLTAGLDAQDTALIRRLLQLIG